MINILLVEDSPSDQLLTQEALKDSKLQLGLHIVESGVEALEFLHKEGIYKDKPTPDLILLDLNLPKMDGRETLNRIRSNGEPIKDIPIVILTTSTSEEDVLRTYALHCNCYISKPLDFNKFVEIVRSIENFWFSVVRLPRKA
jgi:chemotaxis family two-component system response regulator Rcp1